jgi:transmembrane sensor
MTRPSKDGRTRSAAEWFAIMRGPGADGERAAFEAWRAVPGNDAAYSSLEETWDQSLFLANRPAGRSRDLARARGFAPRAVLLAAGVGAFAILSGGLVASQLGWLGQAAAERSAVAEIAATNAIRTVRLADGSRVTLDRGSALRDASSASTRRFVLLRGRARFDVAHDARRAFVVDAGAGQIIAHGTIFDVGLEGQAVRVALLRGSVEVRQGEATPPAVRKGRFLSPGEQLVVAAGDIGATSRTTAAALAWPDPMIGFDDVPLPEAIAAFNRTSVHAVRLADGAPAVRRVSGAFRRDDPRAFADALAASFGLDVRTGADGSLVLHAEAAAPD